MPAFSIPLSGLDADQQALSVVANNLANMNTVGYKDQQVNFQDLLYQTLGQNGAGNQIQVGSGSSVASVSGDFNNGDISSTGVDSDVAISGNGFLVTQLNGTTQYTRAGDFQVNTAGYLTTQEGQYVMGYSATNGTINQGALTQLQVGTGSMVPATATSSADITANLSSGTATNGTYSTTMNVYDSLGTEHTLNFTFTKTASNTWSYNVTIPSADLSSTSTSNTVGTGTLTFNSDGTLATVNSTAVSSTAASTSAITVSNLGDGAANLTVNWGLSDAKGNSLITQTSSDSAATEKSQNGYASGTLEKFSVANDGTIDGTFSNGQTLAIGQLAMAQFGNDGGLSLVGNNSYQSTASSGQAVIGTAGTGGLGTLTGGSIEASNVDMATEFSNMIIDQRAYEANAKVISAFDQISQDTINIQR